MKIRFGLLASLVWAFVSMGAAAGAPDLTCVSGFPTTSMLLVNQESDIRIEIIHHNELKYIPAHRGTVTLADFPRIKANAEFLASLGERFQSTFKKEECEYTEQGLFWCIAKTPRKIGELPITGLHFLTTDLTEKILGFEFKSTVAKVGFRYKKNEYSVEMPYLEGECRMSKDKVRQASKKK